jgi:orotate phosphoribosyltransferase
MKEVLITLLREYAYKKGEFKLSSGRTSEHYINCKPVTLSGEGLKIISIMILECLHGDVQAVAGLTLGADPLVSGVAVSSVDHAWAPTVNGLIVRKEPKGHGTGAWIEGPLPLEGSKIVVLEDVVTTGGSAIKAAQKLRDAGYIVEDVITIVDRQVPCPKCNKGEADTAMKDAKLRLTSLLKLEDIAYGT